MMMMTSRVATDGYTIFLAAKPNGRDSLKLEINIESFGRKITRKERLSRVVAKNGR